MSAAEPELTTEKVGTVIDRRYRITGLLGRGGMGSVYQAEHVRIRRPVAIKLLHPEYGQVEEIAKRFEREAFATGRITHPNIVTISDFGELEDGTLFLVMELLDGVSLGDVMAEETRLAPARALSIIKHVLRGLGHAHASQIIHRDVKPENVLLVEHAGQREFGKLLDFGIAKLVGEAETEEGGEKLTQAGIAFGTPAYISPEQATGSTVDHRADLYSTSVMLYEMLAGRPPFVDDDKLKLLAQHATRRPPPLAEVAPDLEFPRELEAILMRGLEKHPEDRWASAEDYLAAIEAYEESRARRQVPTPMPQPTTPLDTSGTSALDGVSLPPTPRSAATYSTTSISIGDQRKRRVTIGLVVGGIILLVIILANAARSGSSDPSALEAALTTLSDGKTCADRKKAIPKLVELRDTAAVPALKTAAASTENKCLREAAETAIKRLEDK